MSWVAISNAARDHDRRTKLMRRSQSADTVPMTLKSFIDVPRDSHFPIQNLPFGVFKPRDGVAHIGVAIGEFVLDLTILEELGHLRAPEFKGERVFARDCLNDFFARGRPLWRKTREI